MWARIILFCFFCGAASFSYALDVPTLGGRRIVDKANLLSERQLEDIDRRLRSFESGTKGQMVVLIIPSLAGEVLESYSLRVANEWGIGYKDKNNGLFFLIALKERKTRLEVGLGWEKTLTNSRAAEILSKLVPYFRKKDFKRGIFYVIESAEQTLARK